jgi:hypothetical protein
MPSPYLDSQLLELFGWSQPKPEHTDGLIAIRTAMARAAKVIIETTPWCDDQQAAIRLLRQAAHMATCALVKPGGGRYVPLPPKA